MIQRKRNKVSGQQKRNQNSRITHDAQKCSERLPHVNILRTVHERGKRYRHDKRERASVRNYRNRALHYEGCDPVRSLGCECLRNRREAVTLNKLVKHPGIYDCARVHLCQPPFNFLDKCAVRDAVPIHTAILILLSHPAGRNSTTRSSE